MTSRKPSWSRSGPSWTLQLRPRIADRASEDDRHGPLAPLQASKPATNQRHPHEMSKRQHPFMCFHRFLWISDSSTFFFPAFEDSPRGSTYTAHMRPARPRAQRRNNKKKLQMTPKRAPGSKGEGVRVRVFGLPCESAGVQHRVHALGCSGFRVCWFTLLGSGADVRWFGSGVRHCVFRFWS